MLAQAFQNIFGVVEANGGVTYQGTVSAEALLAQKFAGISQYFLTQVDGVAASRCFYGYGIQGVLQVSDYELRIASYDFWFNS